MLASPKTMHEHHAQQRVDDAAFIKALGAVYPTAIINPPREALATKLRPISPALVESLMADSKPYDPFTVLRRNSELAAQLHREKIERRRPLSTAVIESVAEYFKLKPEDLTGKSRYGYIVSARFVAMRLLFEMRYEDGARRFSYPMIGRFFGGRDHSTVIHAMRTFDDRARAYPEMREAYEALKDG